MIKRVCLYCSKTNFNLLPAVVITFKDEEFIIAFKFFTFHFGIAWGEQDKTGINWNFKQKSKVV